jgi:hypothetical protein
MEQALPLVEDATTMREILDILDRVTPPLYWYKDEEGNLTDTFLVGTAGGFANSRDWVATGLDSDIAAARIDAERRGNGRRKTRKPRKNVSLGSNARSRRGRRNSKRASTRRRR